MKNNMKKNMKNNMTRRAVKNNPDVEEMATAAKADLVKNFKKLNSQEKAAPNNKAVNSKGKSKDKSKDKSKEESEAAKVSDSVSESILEEYDDEDFFDDDIFSDDGEPLDCTDFRSPEERLSDDIDCFHAAFGESSSIYQAIEGKIPKRCSKNPSGLGDQIFTDSLIASIKYEFNHICVESQMSIWLKEVKFTDFAKEITKVVIGQEKLVEILAFIYMYIVNISNGKPSNTNIILTAPSGSGKTETYRALKTYFKKYIPKFPIIQVDMTSITQEGFKGKDTIEIVNGLKKEQSKGVGIIFMDEFDKKIMPNITSNGEDVNKSIQSQILTLIEGREIDGINTNLTMFIGLGSFDQCRKSRAEKPKSMGFNPINEKGRDHYDEITLSDIELAGGIPELIGRFSSVINFHALDRKAVDKIINKAIERLAAEILQDETGKNLRISKDFREYLHSQANTVYGCRRIYNVIGEQVRPALTQLLLKNKNPMETVVYISAVGKYHFSSKKNNSVSKKTEKYA